MPFAGWLVRSQGRVLQNSVHKSPDFRIRIQHPQRTPSLSWKVYGRAMAVQRRRLTVVDRAIIELRRRDVWSNSSIARDLKLSRPTALRHWRLFALDGARRRAAAGAQRPEAGAAPHSQELILAPPTTRSSHHGTSCAWNFNTRKWFIATAELRAGDGADRARDVMRANSCAFQMSAMVSLLVGTPKVFPRQVTEFMAPARASRPLNRHPAGRTRQAGPSRRMPGHTGSAAAPPSARRGQVPRHAAC